MIQELTNTKTSRLHQPCFFFYLLPPKHPLRPSLHCVYNSSSKHYKSNSSIYGSVCLTWNRYLSRCLLYSIQKTYTASVIPSITRTAYVIQLSSSLLENHVLAIRIKPEKSQQCYECILQIKIDPLCLHQSCSLLTAA